MWHDVRQPEMKKKRKPFVVRSGIGGADGGRGVERLQGWRTPLQLLEVHLPK